MANNFPITSPYSIRLGIIGAGTMGSGIALAALFKDMFVTLYDVSPEMLEKAGGYLEQHLLRKNRSINLKRVTLTTDLKDLAGSGVVIEAALEKLEVKKEIFRQLDDICPPPAILATNTSTLPVTAIAAELKIPARAAGMHFFNPAPVLPLVEVVRGAQTSDQTIDTLASLAEFLGKTPVVTKDTPGFIVNRVARPFYGEALRLLGEGAASHEDIDRLVRLGAGFKMGPFQLMDLIGIDINYAAMQSMYDQTYGEPRYRPHPIQAQMVHQKALGEKSGRGFYFYDREVSGDPKIPEAQKGNKSIAILPGSWAPGLVPATRETGHVVYEFASRKDNEPDLIIVPTGKDERLVEQITDLEEWFPQDTPILCQCTDVTLAEVASWMENPDRLVGFDGLFFNGSKAISLVTLPGQTARVRQLASNFFEGLGRLPVWTQDSPALVLPRILAMLANEAAFAAGEGVATPEIIDTAMQLGTNYPYGPLAWAKEVSYTKVVKILNHLFTEYHEERYRVAPLLQRLARLEK